MLLYPATTNRICAVGFRALKLLSFQKRLLAIDQQARAAFAISCASDLEQFLR
jgi:hypothetical protein